MSFTFWHRGQPIGETDFEQEHMETVPHAGERRHLAGIFRPTPYGRRLLPRLCGIMSAGFELKQELASRGLSTDDVPQDVLEYVFGTTAAGVQMLDVGRVLCEVRLRDPGGVTLQVASMAFIDLSELASLSAKLGVTQTVDLDEVSSEVAEFLVSVTLSDLASHCGPMTELQ
jgi:hypothetical protein